MGNKRKTKERKYTPPREAGGGGESETPKGDTSSSVPPAEDSVWRSDTVLSRQSVLAGTSQDVSSR